MTFAAGDRLGSYEILGPIGAGGMGEVYRARDTKLDREVAIKVLPAALAQHPDRLARFEREAKVLAALNHPNIAQIYGIEDRAIVMELVDGLTLADRIRSGAIPVDESLKIMVQIADALEAAHEKGVVHRDLKPANIKVRDDGTVKVLDFGLATAVHGGTREPGEDANSPTLTMGTTEAGVILGTAAYMSPEQAAGKPVDRRADIWSFGVVLWEMLTGKRLFEGETVSHTLADVLRAPIDFEKLPKGAPPAIRELLRRCLDRDVKTRLRDIGEARIAIQKYLADPRPEEPALAAAKSARRAWRWFAVAAGVVIVALGAIAMARFREAPPQRQRVRFQLAPPQGNFAFFGLSPDGRYLALATRDGLSSKIWIKALDSLETRLVASFSEANPLMFWSPDGEYLGFNAGGKLYKIARAGGPSTALCEAPGQFMGGAWRSDGTILFSVSGMLYRVSSSGGSPTKIDAPANSRVPAWLKGDKYLVSTLDGIMAGSLRSAKFSKLLPDRSNVVVVPPARSGLPAHLLFRRGETLMAQPIDQDNAELRAEAFPVADHVGSFGNIFRAAFSASATGVLVFGGAAPTDRELVWIDRNGRKLQTVSKAFAPAANPAIRLSPDDSRAIVPVSGGDYPDLWIADLNRNTFSRFTFDGSSSGIWSPDGRKVLWAARDGSRNVRAADGSGKDELLFKNPTCGTCYPNDWSFDGKRIAFSEQTPKTQFDAWLVETDGDRKPYPYLQSRFNETWSRISPDGRWMAYVTDQPGQQEIMIQSIPLGKGRWQISTQGGEWPEWRRDGKELFFRQDTKIIAVPMQLTETTVESGKPQTLFEVPVETRFQVSRDGQRFLIAVPVEGVAAAVPITVDTDWRAGVAR